MAHYDVFNGDADGLCALQQLRLEDPRDTVLVTGVKRDIALLGRVAARGGDTVTVLDVSMERNLQALHALLDQGVAVAYFDHHEAGAVPRHPLLAPHLDPAPEACTSILVDRFLGGARRAWAVVGAYGDGLAVPAGALADALGLTASERQALRELGEAINYNAYGESEADLLVPPAQLARLLRPCADPFAFAATAQARSLCARRAEDLARGLAVRATWEGAGATATVLPDAPWARRVQGTLAHALADRVPDRAQAVLCPSADGCFVVSLRAPRVQPTGAAAVCRRFAGGGRAGAAGIDALPRAQWDAFLQALQQAWPGH